MLYKNMLLEDCPSCCPFCGVSSSIPILHTEYVLNLKNVRQQFIQFGKKKIQYIYIYL